MTENMPETPTDVPITPERAKELARRPFAQFNPTMMMSIIDHRCPSCGANISKDGFRDELSKKEYNISGLCQKCQDSVFG